MTKQILLLLYIIYFFYHAFSFEYLLVISITCQYAMIWLYKHFVENVEINIFTLLTEVKFDQYVLLFFTYFTELIIYYVSNIIYSDC